MKLTFIYSPRTTVPMHQIPRALGAALAVPALLLASACGSGGAGAASSQPGQLKVVVAFYPFQYAAERVAGSDANIENLTQPGAEPHDLELTPKQVAALSDADVVVHQKGFQPAVDKAIEQAKPKKVVDVATLVHLHGATEGEGDGHEHEASDPHAWLDPTTMMTVTRAINDNLAAARPEKKAAFAANTDAAVKDLTALDDAFKAGLTTCQRKEFVTSHAAFGYLAERYGLTQVSVRGLRPDDEPSPARIAEVQQVAKDHGVTTIFYEELVSPAVSESIARDLGLRTDVLDPLEGLTEKSRGKNYVDVMQSNLTALRAANECA